MQYAEHPVLGRVALRDGKNDREDLINAVVAVFEEMGCVEPEKERERLFTDEQYFRIWVLELPMWCPGLAEYVDCKPRRSPRNAQ